MAEISKQALKVANNTEFPNNNAGAITPSRLRGFNTDMIDSLVDEISYTADSASWNAQIDALEQFTASLDDTYVTQAELAAATGALEDSIDTKLNTSSFNAFSQSIDSRVDALEAFSTSLDTNFASQTEFNTFTASIAGTNAFTQSADQRLDSIEAQSGSWVTSAITASSLTTASFAAGTLTFTKGDGTTFGVVIPDVSGSTIDTGSFATTGSNTFTGVQNFNADITASNTLISGDLVVDPTTSTKLNGNTDIGAFLYINGGLTLNSPAEITWLGTGNIGAGFSASVDARINAITGSGGTINTGSFATTGSNSFVGNQTITGSVTISGSATTDLTVVGQIFVSSSATGGTTAPRITVSGSAGVTRINRNNITITDATDEGGMFPSTLYTKDAATFDEIGFTVDPSVFSISGWSTGPAIYVNNDALDTYPAVIGFQNKANYTDGRVAVLTPLSASAGFTASLQNGYAWVGNSLGQNTQVATSSFGSTIDTGSFATTGSNTFTGNQTITTSGNTDVTIQSTAISGQTNLVLDAFQNNVTAKGQLSFTNNGQFGGSGSVKFISSLSNIEFASDAGTRIGATNGGGNGIDSGYISLQSHSGSLSLAPSGISNTTASLLHISSSSGTNFVNLMFKNNSNTATTVISGSNNIFTNPTAPTAGFIRHIGGSNNLMLNSGSVPQISGSMLTSPSLMGNILSNVSSNPITLRGPVSASAYSITQNILMGGQINYGASAANSFDKATAGMTTQGNALFNATINVNAPTTPLSSSVTLTGNLLFGASVTLNCFSSSIAYASNVQNGGITVNNSYVAASGSSAAVLSARANVNTIYGVGHALNISGTNTSTTQGKQFYANLLAGTFISSSMPTGDNCNILATGVIGNSLIITGSTLTSTFAGADTANTGQGSLFAGRFNSVDGTKDQTGETVFAVGTGTSNTNRKTGFLIDSGSNTFVEGSLNVSGSTIFSGSTFISNLQNGITDVLVTYDTTTGELRKATASDILSSSFDAGEFWSTVTQSGSAGVSGSITFNNSGSVAGISVVNNSQITLSQDGTYNIQFSAQIESTAGADTVYIWFKKNGANISDSASKAVLANNTAQIMTVNLFDTGVANDYYELAYQTTNGHATVLYEPAAGNIPTIPSVILTIQQIR
jgi:hypothetical protein